MSQRKPPKSVSLTVVIDADGGCVWSSAGHWVDAAEEAAEHSERYPLTAWWVRIDGDKVTWWKSEVYEGGEE